MDRRGAAIIKPGEQQTVQMIEYKPFGPAGRSGHHAHPLRPQPFIADNFQRPGAGLDDETVAVIFHADNILSEGSTA